MKPLHLFLQMSCLGLNSLCIQAQNYVVSNYQVPYSPLESGFPLTEFAWDNPAYVVPIGFEIPFFDVLIDEMTAEFGSGGMMSTYPENNRLSIMYVIGADLIDRGYHIGASMSAVIFDTIGSPGKRVFIQEWINAGFAGGDTSYGIYTDFINFQLRLYEGSGDIEYHFGTSSITNPEANFDGLPGPVVGLVDDYDLVKGLTAEEVYLLYGNPDTPGVANELGLYHLSGPIPENTVFRFRNTTTSLHPVSDPTGINSFFPNPTSGNLRIRDEIMDHIAFPILVHNGVGQLVKQIENMESLNFHHLPDGLYFLEYSISGKKSMERILHIADTP